MPQSVKSLTDDELQRVVLQAVRRWQQRMRSAKRAIPEDADPLPAALRREVERRAAIIPTFNQLVRFGIAAGHTRKTAEAHARKVLATYDVIEVNRRTGRWRFVTDGPSILDLAKTPTRKRPKGKTRKLKGAE